MTKYNFKIKNKDYKVDIISIDESIAKVEVNGEVYEVELKQKEKKIVRSNKRQIEEPSFAPKRNPIQNPQNTITAPLPGVIIELAVKEGDKLSQGSKLLVLEAMKMENEITASKSGVISKIHINQGDSVLEGDLLITIE